MAAAPNDDSWIELQRRREERMRFEVLAMLYQACGGEVDSERNAWGFAVDLGIWHAELFRIVEWLAAHGLIRYCGAGPIVCLTQRGVDFIERPGERRRSIRESDL
jgi:predicted transcriptional regulator